MPRAKVTAAAACVVAALVFACPADAQGPLDRIVDEGPSVLQRPLHRKSMMLLSLAIVTVTAACTVYASRQHRRQKQVLLLQQERDRMSRSLHDGMDQGFSAIGVHLEAIESSLSQTPQDLEGLRRLLGQTRAVLDRSKAAAQQAVWDLRDLQNHTPDLGASLQAMVRAQMLGRSEPLVTLNVGTFEGPRNLFAEQELCLLAQEAIMNALRHSGAKNVLVETGSDRDFIHLSIADDGVGILKNQETLTAESGHFGLLGMQERVRRLGGTMTISSPPSEGTWIVVRVPTGKITSP